MTYGIFVFWLCDSVISRSAHMTSLRLTASLEVVKFGALSVFPPALPSHCWNWCFTRSSDPVTISLPCCHSEARANRVLVGVQEGRLLLKVKDQGCERRGLAREADMTLWTTHTHGLEGKQSVHRVHGARIPWTAQPWRVAKQGIRIIKIIQMWNLTH